MDKIQRDVADKVFSQFIALYKNDHPKFEYEEERAKGRYANSYTLTISYKHKDKKHPIEVRELICMYYDAPFLSFRTDQTKTVIERGLVSLQSGLRRFEEKVKRELTFVNEYDADELVSNAYKEFMSNSTLAR